jgi:hypothetical protein
MSKSPFCAPLSEKETAVICDATLSSNFIDADSIADGSTSSLTKVCGVLHFVASRGLA